MKKLIFALILLYTQAYGASFTSNYTLIEEAMLDARSGDLQKNYGASTSLGLGYSWGRLNIVFRVLNIADSLPSNATVDSAYFSIYMHSEGLDATDSVIIRSHALLIDWGEGDNTGTKADAGECCGDSAKTGTVVWTSDCAEGSGTDRASAGQSDGVHPDSTKFKDGATIQYYKFWLNQTTVKNWRTTNYGIVIRASYYSDDDDRVSFRTSEYTGGGERPSFTCYYTVGEVAAKIGLRRKKIILGE